MKKETMDLQSYLLYNISCQLYKLTIDPNANHSEIKFDIRIGDSVNIEDIKSELNKSWIFKGMYPELILSAEATAAPRAELSLITVKEIIDKCTLFRRFRSGLDKVSVRESAFDYKVYMELDEESEKEIRDNLVLRGINIYEDSIDQDINTDDLEICVHLQNGTYIVRTKKK